MSKIALGALALACLAVAYYFSVTLPHEREAAALLTERAASLELTRKCSEDGRKYYQQYVTDWGADSNLIWDSPEFHYSKKLNTCLIHIRNVKSLSSGESIHTNTTFDIYANHPVVSGYFRRDLQAKSEKVLPSLYGDTPNYTSEKYFAVKAQMFAE